MKWNTPLLAAFALLMFAANSLICRMALGAGVVDAASYATIRMVSGAITLLIITGVRHRGQLMSGDWSSAFYLFLYAMPFAFAYNGLTTGMGALILFGCVQLTMLLTGWRSGERFSAVQWVGMVIALCGLVVLLLPGLHAPRPLPALLMAVAGAAWGVYSLRGRDAGDPLLRTAGNFVRTVPMVLLVSLIALPSMKVEWKGAVLAAISGAGASALGYIAWYAALKQLTASRAATLQLLVPVIAAIAGVLVLAEPFDLRIGLATALVVGGVALALRRGSST